MNHVVIYTDGGCVPNPGTGGWAAVMLIGTRCKVVYGGEQNATNNRMEMFAAIQGLRSLTRPIPAIIYTDSQYLQKGASIWLANWIKKDKLRERKNPDLWQEIHNLQSGIPVHWKWVKGHAGNRYNELADNYAFLGRKAAESGDFSAHSVWLS